MTLRDDLRRPWQGLLREAMRSAAFGVLGALILAPTVSLWQRSSLTQLSTDFVLPNPLATPGAVDSFVTVVDSCNGTTRARRAVTPAARSCALRRYNEDGRGAELDHLIPLELGGSNSCDNLWPQPWVEADMKDRCEDALRAAVCHGTPRVDLRLARHAIAEDWIAACRPYLGAKP